MRGKGGFDEEKEQRKDVDAIIPKGRSVSERRPNYNGSNSSSRHVPPLDTHDSQPG